MSYKLTMSQREVLEALVRLYEKYRRLVKSKEIAEVIGRDEGTVRNIILSLKSLGLVESKTGPTGGYMPTLKAFEILRGVIAHVPVKLQREGIELDITVVGIELIDIFNPEGGRALLRVHGNLHQIKPGDTVRIGPTPYVRLIVEGEVTHVDRVSGQVGLRIKRLVSIPRVPVREIASRDIIWVTPDTPIREAARILEAKRIHGVPVFREGRLVGIFTMCDLARAVTDGRVDAKVEDYMSSPVYTVREDEDILRAIELMRSKNVGRLVVVSASGQPIGIITKTDILRYISALV